MSGANSGARTIAAFLRGDPFPWPPIQEPGEGVRFAACYCVEQKQLLLTKGDKPYLRLQLADRSGTIEGRVWDDAERIDSWVRAGAYIGIRGRIQSYRNQRQLKIEEIEPLHVSNDELDLFLPATDLDLDALEAGLDALIASVVDRPLRQLLEELVGADSETGRAFRRAPAAKRNHHAYIGGLLEHTLSITRIADLLAGHYGRNIDRDLLVTGAILHDIGKIQEIAVTGGFPYTDPGKLLGHILLGIQLVRDAARTIEDLEPERLLLVLHLIASHQGKYEWQSPRIPHTLEALILHFADDIDAKMNQATALVDSVEEGWTPYDGNFAREFFRHAGPIMDLAGPIEAGQAGDRQVHVERTMENRRYLETEYLESERIETEHLEAERVDAERTDQATIFDLL
jgi:3'-5' exoribonuclease